MGVWRSRGMLGWFTCRVILGPYSRFDLITELQNKRRYKSIDPVAPLKRPSWVEDKGSGGELVEPHGWDCSPVDVPLATGRRYTLGEHVAF